MSLPVVMTEAGATPQTAQSLHNQIVSLAVASDPGLTANLPGTLIEDIASTDTAALVLIDQAQVETINSMTPYGCNLFILNQLGQIYGVQQGVGSNTSVYVVFSGTAGYVIPQGTIVADGTYQYVTQEATAIGVSGSSNTVYAIANISGSWAVPANTVTTITSSIPSGVTLSVTNPTTGTPSVAAQSAEDYRAQVIQAGLVACSGTVQAIKAQLQNVSGVVSTLISIRQNNYYSPAKWEVIVGGGDPYAVANAIWLACGDPNTLCGSTMLVTAITQANPALVTTNQVSQFTDGQTIYLSGVGGMTALNGVPLTITNDPADPFSFTIGVDTTGYPAYTSGGIVSTSSSSIVIPRNENVTIYNTPDSYVIPFVVPIQQPTSIQITWSTNSTNVISNVTIQALCAQPVTDYVNALGPGEPINEYDLQYVFQASIASVLPVNQVTYIAIQVTINGIVVAPTPGTGIVSADPEGYYFVGSTDVTTVRV